MQPPPDPGATAFEHPARPGAPLALPAAAQPFLRDVLTGLSRPQRAISSRWLYDARGSLIFQWISQLPDYYPTRVEREILEARADEIVAPVAREACTVVDLGAGDGHKSQLLLDRLVARGVAVTYAPIDVSPAALDEACDRVRRHTPGVALHPTCAEYEPGLRRLAARGGRGPRLVLFLGSSIGNLEHAAALDFLGALRRTLRRGDHALVGFDRVKPLAALRRAYDDPQGLTRAFNLNLLHRMNRELGADFEPAAFRHRATWDPRRPAMESWLESTRRQLVRVAGFAFRLERGERIHTEISCKYRPAQIASFARGAGFAEVRRFHDPRRWFADALWRVG